MDDRIHDFRFPYRPATVRYGLGAARELGSELDAVDRTRALLVTGQTVGATGAVMDPVREGLGDRLAGTFAKTTTDKRVGTARTIADRAEAVDADCLVAVGGGSSLDLAKVAAVLRASGATAEEARDALRGDGIEVPDGDLTPLFAVPTTLAGADLSVVAGVTTEAEDEPLVVRGGVFDPRLMPESVVYDPALFETTPHGVLCASAMNGFDKGVETVYARNATPVTDATATRGLELLRRGLPRLGAGDRDDETLHDCLVGTALVQYGCSRTDGTTLSVLHAYGHAVARGFAVQQGGAHAIVAPHALSHLFDAVDARRDLLAPALGVESSDPGRQAEGIVEAVTAVRDALGLPTRLRGIEDMVESDLPAVARSVVDDGFMPNRPEGYDPTPEEIEGVLRSAW